MSGSPTSPLALWFSAAYSSKMSTRGDARGSFCGLVRHQELAELNVELCVESRHFALPAVRRSGLVDAFMQKIDILVVPSIAYESFGMVILEAMKHKKAVICSDFGGMKEVVETGVTGLVVPAGDDLALANAISILLSDGDLRYRMGSAGYERFNELFTSEKMAFQYEELIN